MLSEEKKMMKKLRWMEKDCKVWNKKLYRKGTSLVVGIRSKPVMYSQLTPEEKKIYHDKEMEKRKKNGKTGV